MLKLTLGIFLVIISITAASAIKCFQCNSIYDVGCLNLTSANTNSTYYKECNDTISGKKTFCRKTVFIILGADEPKRVRRTCGWEIYKDKNEPLCYESDTDFKVERSCQCFEDGCNAGYQQSVHFGLIAIGLNFLTLFGYRGL